MLWHRSKQFLFGSCLGIWYDGEWEAGGGGTAVMDADVFSAKGRMGENAKKYGSKPRLPFEIRITRG